MGSTIFVFLLVYVILFSITFILYAFNSVGLYIIAKNEEKKAPFLAWIPYVCKYTQGDIAFSNPIISVIMVICNICVLISCASIYFLSTNSSMLLYVLIFNIVLSIVCVIFDFVSRHFIYNKYSKSTILMTLFDILSLGILGSVFIFAIKENDMKQIEQEEKAA